MAAAAFRLPQFIVVKPYNQIKGYNAYYKKNTDGSDGGSLALGSESEFSIFSPLVKIEAERATTSNKNYVNLRFCNSNRYWQKAVGDVSFDPLSKEDTSIVARSKESIEDTSDESCTLFEPFPVGNDSNSFYLKHVSSGMTLVITGGSDIYLSDLGSPPNESAYLTYVDWETLVKLPDHVALKGDNGMYIQPYTPSTELMEMLFYGAEGSDYWSVYKVVQLPDGHVQLISEPVSRNWKSIDDLILLEYFSEGIYDDAALFWPVKIDGDAIVLQNKKTGRFCMRGTVGGRKDCLASTGSTIMAATKLQVEEPTMDRKIYYVNYMMEDARIFDEQPYLAGSSVLVNATDDETSQSVTITHQDQKSYSFSRGFSITAGVKTDIKAKIPLLAEGKIEVSLSITGNFQWDTTTTTTTSVSATGTVQVPARSSVVIDYVGTQGSVNIPYAYTQLDKSATDGKIKRTEHIDGTYTGVSCYDFSFKMRAPKSMA